MLSLNEFLFMAGRPWQEFWGVVRQNAPNQAVVYLKNWQIALHAYAKRNHGNGTADDIQLRAMEHEKKLYIKLLRWLISHYQKRHMRSGMPAREAKYQARAEAEKKLKGASY